MATLIELNGNQFPSPSGPRGKSTAAKCWGWRRSSLCLLCFVPFAWSRTGVVQSREHSYSA